MEDEINKIKYYRNKRNRTVLFGFFSVISIVISIILFSAPEFIYNVFFIRYQTSIIIGATLFISGLGTLLSAYLNTRPHFINRRYNEYEQVDLNSIFNYHLKKSFIDKYGSTNSWKEEENKDELFRGELDSFKQKFIEQSTHDLEFAHLFEDLFKLENKFKSQIDRLISNSNLNLIIGIITTLLAVILLGFSMFQEHKFTTTVEFLSFFTPRISTVIFVEIFSFFFLKLYKNNLNEIKYFQNEITNLNFKISALKTAIKTQNKDAIDKVISVFSVTERNFILKKDETTEKLESHKIESSESSKYSKSMTDLINAIKK